VEMAQLFRGETMRYEVFPQRLAELDVVITSSAAPEHVLTREAVRRALETRKNQPIFLIDIAVPRNIDPSVETLEHAFLYDIDDLKRLADRNLQARQGVAQQAETIVTEEVERLEAKLREREAGPVIVSLQEQLESIRQDVLAKHRTRLGNLTDEQENAVESLTRSIVNKIAHGPISEIRREAAEQAGGEAPREAELASVVRRMFRLRER
jgi:glutamyl-tRNA reductase